MIQTDAGRLPDFDNRYFKCDFGYGLDILLQFAEILNLDAPTMKKIMSWYNVQAGDDFHHVNLRSCGLSSKEKILAFYN